MKKTIMTLFAVGVLAVGIGSSAASSKVDKVTICHATGSQTNPYVRITPSASGVINGHVGSDHQGGRDIIPPFSYTSKGEEHFFPGQNWDATGQAIWNNGCNVPVSNPPPGPPPPPPPPPGPPPPPPPPGPPAPPPPPPPGPPAPPPPPPPGPPAPPPPPPPNTNPPPPPPVKPPAKPPKQAHPPVKPPQKTPSFTG
jgi:hypothetical protein